MTGASVALPLSEDAEQAVLSAIFAEPGVLASVSPVLAASDFADRRHAQIYAAMLEVAARGDTVTPVTLCDVLSARGGLDAAGGKDFIAWLIDVVPSAAGVESHARIVRDHAQRRALVLASKRMLLLAETTGAAPSAIAAEVRSMLQNFERASDTGTTRLAAPTSITALIAAPEPTDHYIVDGLVPADGNLLLAAYPKSHKTNLVLGMSVSATTALPFLGRFSVSRRHRVGLVLMEDRAHRVRRRLRRLCEAHSIDLEDLNGYLHTWFRPILRLNDPRVMDDLRGYVERLDLDMLWIDSWAYVATGNSDDSDVVAPQLDALSRLRDDKPGLAVGLTHHARKTQGDTTGQRLTDVIRNSSHFSAWYDAGYVLSRTDETSPVTVRAELRDLPAPASFSFLVEDEHAGDPANGIAPSGWMRLRALDATPTTVARENAAAKLAPAVREYLAGHPGTSKNQMRTALGGRGTDVDAAFDMLVASGAARCDTPDRKGRAASCWLTSPSSSGLVPSSSGTHSESKSEVRPTPIRGGRTLLTSSAQCEIGETNGTNFQDDPREVAP